MSARYLRKCVGKKQHTDRESATQHRKALAARGFQKTVYRCDQCGTWHVGGGVRNPRGKRR